MTNIVRKINLTIGWKRREKINYDCICPTCRAAFVGTRNVTTAGAPLKIPFSLASNSKEWDTIPPLHSNLKKNTVRLRKSNCGNAKLKNTITARWDLRVNPFP